MKLLCGVLMCSIAALLLTACVVEVTPHGYNVYSVRIVTLQGAHDATPTQEVVQTPAPTATPCVGVVLASPRLNVRAAPSIYATVTTQVTQGARVYIAARVGDWLALASPVGYVWGEYVRVAGACEGM